MKQPLWYPGFRADCLPHITKFAYWFSIIAGEHKIAGLFPHCTLGEQLLDRIRHDDHASVVVLRFAGIERDCPVQQIDLANMEVQQFRNSPAERVSDLE